MAHMVPIGHAIGAAHDSVDDPALLDLHQRLEQGQVCHTIRRGVLRLSFHAYNDLTDVERIVDIAGKWKRDQASPPKRVRA